MLAVGGVPAANVYLGDVPASAVYLGDVQVWPPAAPAAIFQETFDVDMGSWPNFTDLSFVDYLSTVDQGVAGCSAYIVPGNMYAYGSYNFAPNTDDLFVDFRCGAAIRGFIGDNREDWGLVRLRKPSGLLDTGLGIKFAFNPGGDVTISTSNNAVDTVVAEGSHADFKVGDWLRFEARADGRYVMSYLGSDRANVPAVIAEYVDADLSKANYGDPAYRYAHMAVSTRATFGVQYTSYACDTWIYGDISAARDV